LSKSPNIVIIGGNAAGPSAAAKAKRVNPAANVIMVEKGPFISTGTCEMPYVLAGDIESYKNIVFFTPEIFYEEKGARVYANTTACKIDRKSKLVYVKNAQQEERTLPYDSLVLAAGSKANRYSDIDDCTNAFHLKTVEDLVKIKEYTAQHKCKTAAILGAGYIGVETSEALSKLGMEVYLIDRNRLPLSSAEQEIQALVLDELKKNKVNFFGNIDKLEYSKRDNYVKTVKLDGYNLEVDFVIVAIGFSPNTGLASAASIELGKFGGIKVDRKLKTSDYNIYAAGDSIEVVNFITRKPDYIPLASLAHEFGHIAGENAAGGNAYAPEIIKNAAVKIFDNVYSTVGLSYDEAVKYGYKAASVHTIAPSVIRVMPQTHNIFAKIIIDKESGLILGGSFIGGEEAAGYADIISTFIRTKTPAKRLQEINFNYTPPVSPFIHPLSILGKKLNK